MAKLERRKRYFIKRELQSRYLKLILVAIILPTFLFSACLYYLIFYLMAEQLGVPESIAYNLIPVLHKINLILVVGLPIISVAILFWGLIVSHRIAGPVYRLEKDLERMEKGELGLRIKIRKKDELGSIAEGINRLLDKVQGKPRHV